MFDAAALMETVVDLTIRPSKSRIEPQFSSIIGRAR
jgi:hypothetical protein